MTIAELPIAPPPSSSDEAEPAPQRRPDDAAGVPPGVRADAAGVPGGVDRRDRLRGLTPSPSARRRRTRGCRGCFGSIKGRRRASSWATTAPSSSTTRPSRSRTCSCGCCRRTAACRGRPTTITSRGPPELVVEVAHSSRAIDLHAKRLDYARTGVPEYLVHLVGTGQLRWFDLVNDRERSPDADGVIRVDAVPGPVGRLSRAGRPRLRPAVRHPATRG